MFFIKYGILGKCVDITEVCLTKLTTNNLITIPRNAFVRDELFTDPAIGSHKKVFVISKDNFVEYDDTVEINIHVNGIGNQPNDEETNKANAIIQEIATKTSMIHASLKINHGSLNEELPEQKMVVRYLKGGEKVLEIGANIGRNTLMIASILNDDTNFVTLECDSNTVMQLTENRDLNNFKFNIEPSALSKRKLIQKGWDTIPSDVLLDGFSWVNTITFNELHQKYNIEFDTLVLDCEGAFYYILIDMPEILNNINLIIMENDYHIIEQKQYVDETLKKNGFYRDYYERGGWGPCYNNFFEVWRK